MNIIFSLIAALVTMVFLGARAFASIVLPTNPDANVAAIGKDFLVYVNTGTVGTPVWTIVGGQRDTGIKQSADSIDTSTKSSGSWKYHVAGMRGWSFDLSGTVVLGDTGYQALKQAFRSGQQVNIKFLYPDGTFQTGWGTLSSFDITAPQKGEATLKGTIEGSGELTDTVLDVVSPLTAVMSLAAAASKVFTITPSSTVLNSVKWRDSIMALTTDYTYSAGTLTILSTFLDGLTAGDHVFYADVKDGNDLTVTITITA